MRFARRPIRRVEAREGSDLDREAWPATIPAVRQLLDKGLDAPQRFLRHR